MKIIQKILTLTRDDYYQKHLSIINPLLPANLTDKEIEVLAAFMSLDSKITEGDTFNSVARKKVREKLKLSPGGLSNHLKSMIKKGFINKSEITHKLSIKEYLLPEENTQGYQFKITQK